MSNNLLNKMLLSSAVILAITACNEKSGNQVLFDPNIDPVTVDVNADNTTDLVLEFDEDDPISEFDLLDGVVSPGVNEVFARDWTYLQFELDEAGRPIWHNTDELVGYNNLFEGPNLPVGSVVKVLNHMEFDFSVFGDALVHPHTVSQNTDPDVELFSQAVYHFTYLLDNGAKDSVERKIKLTINAVEDLAEELVIKQQVEGEVFKVPFVYQVELDAVLLPANTTYKDITWNVENEDLLSITVDPNDPNRAWFVGHELGNTTVTVTSSTQTSGTPVTQSIPVEVISVPTEPLDVKFQVNGEFLESGASVDVGKNDVLKINGIKVPAAIDFPQQLIWTSSDESVATVDQNGLVSVFTDAGSATITAEVESGGKQFSTVVNGIPHPNLWFESDFGLESGNADTFWNAAGDAAVSASSLYNNGGMYSLEINGAGTAISEPISRLGTIQPDVYLKVTFDTLKSLNWGQGGPIRMITPDSAKEANPENDGNWWWNPAAPGTWNTLTYWFYPYGNLWRVGWTENSPIQISINVGGGQQVYFDNFKVELKTKEEFEAQ